MTDNPLIFLLAAIIALAWVFYFILRPLLAAKKAHNKADSGPTVTPALGGDGGGGERRNSDDGGWFSGFFSGDGGGGAGGGGDGGGGGG